MARRSVTHTRKDKDGDIVALCNPGASWSPRLKWGAISDIENGDHRYSVPWSEGATDIHIANGPTGKYLRTDRDNTERNNLDDLPDC